jgi:pimeloyl-ACP methyl ester carboxylesterase
LTLDTSYSGRYCAILIESQLIVINLSTMLVIRKIQHIQSFAWSSTDDETIYYVNAAKQVVQHTLNQDIGRVHLLLEWQSYLLHANDTLYIVTIQKIEPSSRYVISDNLPINTFDVHVTIRTHKGIMLTKTIKDIINFRVDYGDKLNTKIFIVTTELDGVPKNFVQVIDLAKFNVIKYLTPSEAHGVCSNDYGFAFYCKDLRHGAYSLQKLWFLFYSSGRVINVGTQDNYYGNCTLCDGLISIDPNVSIGEDSIYSIVSEEGNTYIQRHVFGSDDVDIVFGERSSILNCLSNKGILYILSSSMKLKYELIVLNPINQDIIARIPLTRPIANVVVEKQQWCETDCFVFYRDNIYSSKTVLWLPGGPMNQVGYGYVTLLHHLLDQGYRIISINHIGRQGYGIKFATAVRGKWATVEVANILSVIRSMISHGTVSSPIHIIGHSYGCYVLLALISSYHELFDRAVCISGVTNKLTLFGLSDIGYMEYLDSKTFPWNDPDYYFLSSPLYHSQNITAPLLLIHGENDQRVPVAESIQLFTWLKSMNKKVRLARIKTDNHRFIYNEAFLFQSGVVDLISEWLEV